MWHPDWELVESFKSAIGKIDIFKHRIHDDSYIMAINDFVKPSTSFIFKTLEDAKQRIIDILEVAREEIEEYVANNV